MDITRIGSQPSSKGPAEYFTGSVRIDPLFNAPEPARVLGASVTFEPGARTAWSTRASQRVLADARSSSGSGLDLLAGRRGLDSADRLSPY